MTCLNVFEIQTILDKWLQKLGKFPHGLSHQLKQFYQKQKSIEQLLVLPCDKSNRETTQAHTKKEQLDTYSSFNSNNIFKDDELTDEKVPWE